MLLEVDKHALFTSKCFRRGHTNDIADRGGTLFEILENGQWNSRGGYRPYSEETRLRDRLANARAERPKSPEDSPSEISQSSNEE